VGEVARCKAADAAGAPGVKGPSGAAGAGERWKVGGGGGAFGVVGFGEGDVAALVVLPAGGGLGGSVAGEGGGASCGSNFASIWAIAALSAVSSRAMSLSGNGGRKLLSCSSSALRARP
jgi:hypothetical protein